MAFRAKKGGFGRSWLLSTAPERSRVAWQPTFATRLLSWPGLLSPSARSLRTRRETKQREHICLCACLDGEMVEWAGGARLSATHPLSVDGDEVRHFTYIWWLMQLPYWEFFLSIEDELVQTARFVEFNEDHLNVYSIAFSRILMASAAEVDVVAKALCRNIAPETSPERITDYHPVILRRFPRFPLMEVSIPRHGISQKPWESWAAAKSPTWWTAYNKVKHERIDNYNKATLQNAIGATMGLLCVLLHYYTLLETTERPSLDPPPRFLCPVYYGTGQPASIRWGFTIPDSAR